MAEYFIPLTTVIGSTLLEKIPLLGDIAKNVGVRTWRDHWTEKHAAVTAELVIDHELALGKEGGFQVMLGNAANDQTTALLEISADRRSIAQRIAEVGAAALGLEDPATEEEGLQFFLESDAPAAAFRVQIHGLSPRIRLPKEHVQLGILVTDAQGAVVSIEPDQSDGPVDIVLPPCSIVIDPLSDRPLSLVLEDNAAVSIPPFLLRKLGIGFQVEKLKVDFDPFSSIPEALARGYDESWQGVYLEKFRLFGFHKFFPTLPSKVDEDDPADLVIELSKWFFDADGITGSLSVTLNAPDDGRVLKGGGFTIEFDRNNLIRCEVQLTLRVSQLDDPFLTVGPNGDMKIVASGRFSPEGRFGWELALLTPGTADGGLLTLNRPAIQLMGPTFAVFLLFSDLVEAEYVEALLLAGLVGLLAALEAGDMVRFERVRLDALRIRYREEPLASGAGTLKLLDFIVDVEFRIGLDLQLRELLPWAASFVPNIKTDPDHPLGLMARGIQVSYAFNWEDFSGEDLGGRRRVHFSGPNDLSFDFSDQSLLEGSPVMLVKFGVGRWDRGIWMDLGLKLAVNDNAVAYSVVPSAIRLWFLNDGTIHDVTFQGVALSVFVPGVLYCRGNLTLGETITQASLQGYFVATKKFSPTTPMADQIKPGNWLLDVGASYRKEELPDGNTSTVINAWVLSVAGIPLFAIPNTSLYGGQFLYAENARPALGGQTLDRWYADREPKNQISAEKWEAAPGESAFGVGLVIGSTADRGRPWNLKAALMRTTPGPRWLLAGAVAILRERPKADDSSSSEIRFLGIWDVPAERFQLAARYEKKVPADGKILKMNIGLDLLHDNVLGASHVYMGEHWPPTKHARATLLERYDAGFYIMVDSFDIPNFAGLGVTLPGFATALGARLSFEGGRRKGRLKLYYYLRAALDVAIAGTNPMLFALHAGVAGGLVAKVCGLGFEFEVSADFLWVRPQPDMLTGKVKIFIDLPWPIPNIKYTVDFSSGADEPTPDLGEFVEGLNLLSLREGGATELRGGPDQPRVPLDAVLSVAFAFPTRNGPAVDGNFNIGDAGAGAVDTNTYHATSGGQGYAVELKALRLWKGAVGSGTLLTGPFPAKWVGETAPSPGGQSTRRVLEVLSFKEIASTRILGNSAEYVDGLLEDWSPCSPTKPPDPICYVADAVPLGPVADETRLEFANKPPLVLTMLAPDAGAQSAAQFFGWRATPGEVVAAPPSFGVARAIRLPASIGTTIPDQDVAGVLRIKLERARNLLLEVVRPGENPRVVVRFFHGRKLVHEDAAGAHVEWLENRWERVFYAYGGPADRIEIEAALLDREDTDDAVAFLLRTCLGYERDARAFEDAVAGGAAWEQFWSDLLDQDAAASDALLLEPASHYSLELSGEWSRIKDGQEELGGSWSRTFEIDTVGADDFPLRLRGIEESLDGKAGWDVAATPRPGAFGTYPARPIRLEFRDLRTEAVFGAFHRRLVLRIVDENGEDLFDRLSFLRENAKSLPEYELAWQVHVLDAACTTPGAGGLWQIGVAHFDGLLARARRYDATLVALPDTVTDLTAVTDWELQPVVYRFSFRTSRWQSLVDHAAAYGARPPFDEVAVEAPALDELAAALAQVRTTEDVLLEDALHRVLGLPRRPAPEQPEIVRIWRETGGGFELIGLLLDGPEPFPRADALAVDIRDQAANALNVAMLQGSSGARVLVLFRTATGFGAANASALTLNIRESFVGTGGVDVTEDATVSIPVPAVPAFLEPEAAP